jgi:hypothetical protein
MISVLTLLCWETQVSDLHARHHEGRMGRATADACGLLTLGRVRVTKAKVRIRITRS